MKIYMKQAWRLLGVAVIASTMSACATTKVAIDFANEKADDESKSAWERWGIWFPVSTVAITAGLALDTVTFPFQALMWMEDSVGSDTMAAVATGAVQGASQASSEYQADRAKQDAFLAETARQAQAAADAERQRQAAQMRAESERRQADIDHAHRVIAQQEAEREVRAAAERQRAQEQLAGAGDASSGGYLTIEDRPRPQLRPQREAQATSVGSADASPAQMAPVKPKACSKAQYRIDFGWSTAKTEAQAQQEGRDKAAQICEFHTDDAGFSADIQCRRESEFVLACTAKGMCNGLATAHCPSSQ